jgi:hypothetical protein
VCYIILTNYKGIIKFQNVIIAESVAPFLSEILVSKRLTNKIEIKGGIYYYIGMMSLLLILILEVTIDGEFIEKILSINIIIILMLCFIISQYASRIITFEGTISGSLPRISFLNGLFLFMYEYLFHGKFFDIFTTNVVTYGAFIGIIIVLIQRSFMMGILTGSNAMVTLAIGSSVPISIIFGFLLGEQGHSINVVSIGIVYFIAIVIHANSLIKKA